MVSKTCELCKGFGVTCQDNCFRTYELDFLPCRFMTRTVEVKAATVTGEFNTTQPIAECPGVRDPAAIERTAQEWISKAEELLQG